MPSTPSVANTTADKPKSAIFKIASSEGSERRRFSGFKSLWTTPTKIKLKTWEDLNANSNKLIFSPSMDEKYQITYTMASPDCEVHIFPVTHKR